MGVYCIICDFDGMLFEICFNIKFLFSIFHVFFAFPAFKKNQCKKQCREGGGGVNFF